MLKRDPVKYIRDKAKSKYKKSDCCVVCGSKRDLDFHHFYTLTQVLERWLSRKQYNPEDVLDWREEFIEDHHAELYEHAVTICHSLHMKLHSVYGKNPSLGTAKKQMRWIEKQKEKHLIKMLITPPLR